MFILIAGRSEPGWSGAVGNEAFETIEQAEIKMRSWARFGVDNYCSDPDRIWITDQNGTVLKVWDWKTRMAVVPPGLEPASGDDDSSGKVN